MNIVTRAGVAVILSLSMVGAAAAALAPGDSEAMYARTVAAIAQSPTTMARTIPEAQARAAVNDRYMAQLQAYMQKVGKPIPPPRNLEVVAIGTWLGSAFVAASTYCNRAQAQIHLRAARSYINDFEAGSPNFMNPRGDWNPPGLDAAHAAARHQVSRCV